jgi:nucleoside phosphorylase
VSSSPNPPRNAPASLSPQADKASAHVGLCCIHRGELRPFLKRLDRQKSYLHERTRFLGGFLGETTRIVVAEPGLSYPRHRAAAQWMVETHHTPWILSVGFSSSLSPDIHAGDLVLANEIRDTHGNIMPVRCTLKPQNRVHVGRLVVADQHPLTSTAKHSLAQASEALAADTASLAAAQICYERNVRFLAIRAIIDEFEDDIPETAAGIIFRADSRSWGGALGSLFRGLQAAKELHHWRNRAVAASSHLDRFLAGVIEQIAELIEKNRLAARNDS